ncbi:MAG: hypothetical protein J6V74_05470, partial [Bacteroidales bacterium]|nr:hypothetical protein [Bacteroidales bacterium]
VILADGQDIVVAFKGYASPVGNLAYNEIVAKKRISCIQNYFTSYNGGVLNQYLHNEPKSGKGSLKYIYEPIGVVKAENTFYTSSGAQVSAISDRRQKWMSVYSPAAAYQRKIEIIAVDIEYENELFEEISREIKTQKKMVDEVDGTSLYKEGEEPDHDELDNDSDDGFSVKPVQTDADDENKVKIKPSSSIIFEEVDADIPEAKPVTKPETKKPAPIIEIEEAPAQKPAQEPADLKKYDGAEIFKAK